MNSKEILINLLKKLDDHPEITCPRATESSCRGCEYEIDKNRCDQLARKADYLISNGVIALPVKPGDTVYCLIRGFEEPLEGKVYGISIRQNAVIIRCSIKGYFGTSYMATDIGKDVFFTREEAKRSLKERNENGKG